MFVGQNLSSIYLQNSSKVNKSVSYKGKSNIDQIVKKKNVIDVPTTLAANVFGGTALLIGGKQVVKKKFDSEDRIVELENKIVQQENEINLLTSKASVDVQTIIALNNRIKELEAQIARVASINSTRTLDMSLFENNNKDSMFIKIPGTHSLQYSLNELMRNFKINYNLYTKDIMLRYGIGEVNKYDIINGIRSAKGFENISERNAAQVANIINTGVFDDLFSFHGALRFIDRFINFDNNKMTPLEQCYNKTNVLKQLMSYSISDGIECELYQDYKGFIAPRLEINPYNLDNFHKNMFIEYFGTKPLKVTIGYNKLDNRQNLICTIF